MAAPEARHFRLKAAVILFLLTGAVALLVREHTAPGANPIDQASYDSLHRLSGQTWLSNSPVVVVYLDLAAYQRQELDPLKPWPRALHARLLERLTRDSARAVVFDIVFSGAGPSPEGDLDLAKAIRENGRVVLASECNYDSSHATADDQVRVFRHSTIPPLSAFAQPAAAAGLATQAIDDDYAVRRYVAGLNEAEPTLTWAAASFLKLPITRKPGSMVSGNAGWLRYYGPPLSIPHVSYSEALDPTGVPPQFFRDKLVFVGARPLVEQFHERKDEFASPFHSGAKVFFLPGVEVHATEMLNLVRADLLRRLDSRAEVWLVVICAALFGAGFIWLRPFAATVAALAGAATVAFLACLAFNRGIWFPWLLVAGVEIPCAWAGSVLTHSVEWYRARKRFEEAKRIADEKIREQAALIEKAHDAILVQDLGGRTLYANPSAERLYGWGAGALPTEDIFLPDVAPAQRAREVVLQQGEWNGELRQQTRQGRTVTVSSRWTLIRDESGRPKALLMMSTDITSQKELEAQLLRTQRMNTIGSLAGGMAHDLNNALAPILMGVQLLRRKSSDDEACGLLDLMENSTHRGAEMVKQVLLFARGRGSEFEIVQPGRVLRELEKMVRETFPKNISVDCFLADDLWGLRANTTQLHQVVLNLCVNARDAMPNGGILTLVADNVELDAAEAAGIKDGKPGKYVSLSVSDTGTGMSAEVKARIFELFFTTKTAGQGTGIGLATVLRIVTDHSGFLRLESQPGQGTTFEIFLPCAPLTQPTPAKPSRISVRGQGELILLADDEQAIRDLLGAELTSSGFRVLAAANGHEALALFRQHASDVRVFITDGAMPVMDGATAVAAMRMIKPGLPVILTSGDMQAEKMEDGSLVPKPFALDDILAAIQESLGRGKG